MSPRTSSQRGPRPGADDLCGLEESSRDAWARPHVALAQQHNAHGEHEAALTSLAIARTLGEDDALVWTELGLALFRLERSAGAIAALTAAVGRDPRMSFAWHTLGRCLRRVGKYDSAREALRHAVECGERLAIPEYVESLIDLGELDEAQRQTDQYRAYKDGPVARWLGARRAFLAGDLEVAWREYEARFHEGGVERLAHPACRWRGEELAGRSLALIGEQGHGHVIQFARYARLLSDRGARVHLVLGANMRTLAPLLRAVDGVSRVDVVPDISPADLQVPMLSVPYHLGTRLDSIPTGRYLWPPEPGRPIPAPLSRSGGFKVGLVWAGDPKHGNDRHRSTALESMLILASVPDVSLFSLQVGSPGSELHGHQAIVTDLAPWLTDWRDTASLIMALDLVITVDTGVAHLAGALERPVWVALPFAPDWRWLREREDSPWYPSMRLFRQGAPGDWSDVFLRMRDALSTTLPRGGDSR
jgi:hypothetical protein